MHPLCVCCFKFSKIKTIGQMPSRSILTSICHKTLVYKITSFTNFTDHRKSESVTALHICMYTHSLKCGLNYRVFDWACVYFFNAYFCIKKKKMHTEMIKYTKWSPDFTHDIRLQNWTNISMCWLIYYL